MSDIIENKTSEVAKRFVLQTQKNLFLTGKAGTGKTTLLRTILTETKKNTVVVAPTGVAAINAGGMTIHSFFQLPIATFIPDQSDLGQEGFMNRHTLVKQHKLRKEKRKLLMELELLIIDEISMVRADLLDAIDFTLRRIRKSAHPYGGVQMMVIGDLFQLSPVVKEREWDVLRSYYKSPFFFDSTSWRQASAIAIELDKVYRQEDNHFVEVLNRIRIGESTDADINLINEKYNISNEKNTALLLTTHNAKADKVNQEALHAIDDKVYHLEAEVSGKFNESAYPMALNIEVKKGAKVMFTRNHPDGIFFNGKIGMVTDMYDDILFVQSDGDSEKIAVEPAEWKNHKYIVNDKTKEVKIEEIGSFKQYPIRLAWAITVHKSQGLTFDQIQIDLKNSFAPGQLYVALSRCRSLEGLTLSSEISKSNVIVDQRILDFHSTALSTETIHEELKLAIKEYEELQLIEAFSMEKLLAYLEIWEDSLNEKVGEKQDEFLKIAKNVKLLLKDLNQTSQKFSGQLKMIVDLIKKNESTTSVLLNRSNKGIEYFIDQLYNGAVIPLEHKYDKYKKAKSSVLVKNLSAFIHEVWLFIESLYDLNYQGYKVYQLVPKYKRVVVFDASKIKEKRVKGQTYETTLELWEAGKSVDEIAKERNLAVSTIESHLGKLLKEGKVNIQKLMSKSDIDKIYPFVSEHNELDLNDLKAKIPFYTSYAQLRWMRIWYQDTIKDQL